jgi:hypothetical protein
VIARADTFVSTDTVTSTFAKSYFVRTPFLRWPSKFVVTPSEASACLNINGINSTFFAVKVFVLLSNSVLLSKQARLKGILTVPKPRFKSTSE